MMNFTRKLFNGFASVQETRQKYIDMKLDDKRKLYKCRKNYVTEQEILDWPEYAKINKLEPVSDGTVNLNPMLSSKIGVFIGDITCLEIDAIVNAANNSLLGK